MRRLAAGLGGGLVAIGTVVAVVAVVILAAGVRSDDTSLSLQRSPAKPVQTAPVEDVQPVSDEPPDAFPTDAVPLETATKPVVSPGRSLPSLSAAWDPLGTPSVVAQASGPVLPVYAAPGDAEPVLTLNNPQPSGAPLVFLVRGQEPEWLHVLVPVRPNGSTGWIRRADVTLSQHDYRIIVELGAHRISVYQGTDLVHQESVGVGTGRAPTPGGLYYTKELIQPVDANGAYVPEGPYGPYAYGLSGFSEVYTTFAGGDGALAIHGTNDPSGLGRDVSHGCIRMSNEGISRLAGLLPLGVPVEVRA